MNKKQSTDRFVQPTDAILVVGGCGGGKSSEILPHTDCVVPDLVPSTTEDNFLAIHEDDNGEKRVGNYVALYKRCKSVKKIYPLYLVTKLRQWIW